MRENKVYKEENEGIAVCFNDKKSYASEALARTLYYYMYGIGLNKKIKGDRRRYVACATEDKGQ